MLLFGCDMDRRGVGGGRERRGRGGEGVVFEVVLPGVIHLCPFF